MNEQNQVPRTSTFRDILAGRFEHPRPYPRPGQVAPPERFNHRGFDQPPVNGNSPTPAMPFNPCYCFQSTYRMRNFDLTMPAPLDTCSMDLTTNETLMADLAVESEDQPDTDDFSDESDDESDMDDFSDEPRGSSDNHYTYQDPTDTHITIYSPYPRSPDEISCLFNSYRLAKKVTTAEVDGGGQPDERAQSPLRTSNANKNRSGWTYGQWDQCNAARNLAEVIGIVDEFDKSVDKYGFDEVARLTAKFKEEIKLSNNDSASIRDEAFTQDFLVPPETLLQLTMSVDPEAVAAPKKDTDQGIKEHLVKLPFNKCLPDESSDDTTNAHARPIVRLSPGAKRWNGVIDNLEAVSEKPFRDWKGVTGIRHKIYDLFKDFPRTTIEVFRLKSASKDEKNVKLIVLVPPVDAAETKSWLRNQELVTAAVNAKALLEEKKINDTGVEVWEADFDLNVAWSD